MPNLNKCILVGHVTREAEVKTFGSMTALTFGLATKEFFSKRDGTKGEKTTFHNIEVIGKSVDFLKGKIHKGDPLLIEGSYVSEDYTAKDGTKKTIFKLKAFTVEFLKSKESAPSRGEKPMVPEDEDIPF